MSLSPHPFAVINPSCPASQFNHSSTVQTISKHSLVTLTPSSTTAFGRAKLCRSPSPFPTLVLEVPLLCVEFLAARVSARTSCITRSKRDWKLETSPERRRDRAWAWIRVGQLVEFELRAWRRVSWILCGGLLIIALNGVEEKMGVGPKEIGLQRKLKRNLRCYVPIRK